MLVLSVVELVALALVTGLLLYFYRGPGVDREVMLLIFCCWYLAFSGTLLLPMDLACVSGYDDEKKKEEAPCAQPIKQAWLWVYWSTFLLAWVVLPLYLDYLRSGAFTALDKLKDAGRVNMISYGLGLVAGVCLVIYLLAQGNGFRFLVGLQLFGNTYGLLIIIVLMGNGLVEIPRTLWQYSEPETYLRLLRYRATCVDNDLYDAKVTLEGCVADARAAARDVVRMHREAPSETMQLKSYMRMLIVDIQSFLVTLPEDEYGRLRTSALAGAPAGVSVLHRSPGRSSSEEADIVAAFGQAEGQPGDTRRASWMPASASPPPREQTEKSLAELNRRFLAARTRVQVIQTRWDVLVSYVRWVEELAKHRNQKAVNSASASSPEAEAAPVVLGKYVLCGRALKIDDSAIIRLWAKYGHQPFFRSLAVLAGILSALVFWSEAMAAFPILSPFGAILDAVSTANFDDGEDEGSETGQAENPDSGPSAGVQILALLPLLYMSVATYRSLFKFKMVDLFHLQPRGSVATALVFNSTYLIRLQFPLCYNYLLLLGYDDAKHTGFITYLMHRMDAVPILGFNFSVYGGLCLVLIAAFSFFRLHARILDSLGLEHEEMSIAGDEEEEDRVEEGRALLRRAQRAQSRRANTAVSLEEGKDSASATARLLR
mmetsp:Transcript_9983/g.37714  ORF Transcript_9983/g.37714 Transcript_9983/m.37714 type:complete len:658 (+) Transcript_9983:307-2280(+)